MLEYFTYKKVKKHKAEKAAKQDAKKEAEASRLSQTGPINVVAAASSRSGKHRHSRSQNRNSHDKSNDHGHDHDHDHDHDNDNDNDLDRAVIRPGDESFLEELIASDDVPAPPLPPRLYSRDLDWPSDNEDAITTSAPPSYQNDQNAQNITTDASVKEAKDKQAKKQNRLSALFTRRKQQPAASLEPAAAAAAAARSETTPLAEQEKEKKDLSKVLQRLNLSVKNNKVISTDSSAAITAFTNVFKDLVNGVPTAYDDLMRIIDDKDGALARGFDKLPNSLKKLVTQLPDKITSTLGPELLAAAAASQGIKAETSGGFKGAAKSVLLPANLAQLVTKPGAIVSMLRAIVEVLKTRWPAFIGMNVIWGVALSLLLFVLWYCHKRGRQVRLENERAIDGSDRIEELPDDLALPAPETSPGLQTLLDGEPAETVEQARRQKGKARAEA
ncbi:hypothetical protein E4U43_000465 [Claviceps pusilla]|uniref:Ring-like domain-containing protein n=1 Tax=Claviceps pusilla TaxID=123648 RepID=A0A9P7NBV6_9HYPO|nr:hypothetical protein E4U43_000465 [Claviceps pusilla]